MGYAREPRRRDDAESKIAHETTDALTLSGHARTLSGCTSGDTKRTIIKKKLAAEGQGALPREPVRLRPGRFF
jgi:hypothetical protein